ncbi:MAG: hypothetical protein OYL41_00415 [Acidobacteriota bacterium]|nr:hypothetical protein [Acidobacteriota bacterium]MDE3260418.1 hypothetical protein [Acidobacteriota bacterium]
MLDLDDDTPISLGLRERRKPKGDAPDAELRPPEEEEPPDTEPHPRKKKKKAPDAEPCPPEGQPLANVSPGILVPAAGILGFLFGFVGGIWVFDSTALALVGGLLGAVAFAKTVYETTGEVRSRKERAALLDSLSRKERKKYLKRERKRAIEARAAGLETGAPKRMTPGKVVGYVLLALFIWFVGIPLLFGMGAMAACVALVNALVG